jgi:hypothetical protein
MDQLPRILIIGATSAIAEATARLWAKPGAGLFLVARDADKLGLVANDLRLRGATVTTQSFDARDVRSLPALIESAFAALGSVDVALLAHGDLPDQKACEEDPQRTQDALQVNALSAICLLTVIAGRFEAQRGGVIAVIGSVAGDRGRASNYVYGSAKAMLATFLEGLAGRLSRSGVTVLNIKPGFVDTPMTARFRKGPLWSQPEAVARVIRARIAARRSGSFYAPRYWWLIMLIIKHLPARVLYRLKL